MREGWSYQNLGSVATFVNGYPFKPTEWNDTGRRIIRIQNLNNPDASYNLFKGDIDPKYIVRQGDVLISWSGTLGVYEWEEDDEALLNQHIFKVIFDKTLINKQFFKYAVSSRINEMKGKVHGITMQHITKGEFDKTQIPVPALSEQERIVAELDLLTGIIDKQKAQLQELDTLAQSIFYDMFKEELTSSATRLLKDIASYRIGLTYKPTDVAEKGIIVLRSSNIQDNSLDFKDIVRVNLAVDSKKLVSDGDILMCARNGSARLVGKVARIRDIDEEMSFGAFMTTIKSQYNDFLFYFFLSPFFRSQLGSAQTATINQITSKMLDEIQLNVPSLEKQAIFAQKIQSIESQKASINQSIAETQKLFDYTMDKYFG